MTVAQYAATLRIERAPRRSLDDGLQWPYVFAEVDRCSYCRRGRPCVPGALACSQCLPAVERAQRVRALGEALCGPRQASADGILVGQADSGWIAVRVVPS